MFDGGGERTLAVFVRVARLEFHQRRIVLPFRHVVHEVVRRGLVGDDIRNALAVEQLPGDGGAVGQQADTDGLSAGPFLIDDG